MTDPELHFVPRDALDREGAFLRITTQEGPGGRLYYGMHTRAHRILMFTDDREKFIRALDKWTGRAQEEEGPF